jgi:hypothetical protein
MNRILIVGGLIVVVSAAGFLALAVRPGSRFPKNSAPAPLIQSTDNTPGAGQPANHPRVETYPQGHDQLPSSAWARADEETVRLSPAVFADLPSSVGAELRRLGCSIPQTYGTREPHNVIKGRFISNLNIDWAVLCSRDRVSSILVFPGGSADSMVELESSPDVNWLQGLGGTQIGFSRAIDVADPQYIVTHSKAYGGPTPPPMDHDGINNIFIEKASSVLYWHEGQWLQLQGAD